MLQSTRLDRRPNPAPVPPPGASLPWALAALAAALPVLALPIGDPDLWWQLSAAEWMVRHGTWPREDWLSFTMQGKPWTNVGWLSQLLFWAVHRLAGLGGLLAVKAALLLAAGAAVWRVHGLRQVSGPARAAALALWYASLVSRSDIRTELFSVAGFAWLLYLLESGTLASVGSGWRRSLACLGAFCVWANLHSGFAYGLLLLGLYAAADLLGERRDVRLAACLPAAAAGPLVNPYGFEGYAVVLRHGAEIGDLSPYLVEWNPLSLARGHWPTWVWLALAAWLLLRRLRVGGGMPALAAVVMIVFAAAGLKHSRLAAYFTTAAAMLLPAYARDWETPAAARSRRRGAAAAVLAVVFAYGVWCGSPAGVFRRVAYSYYFPVRATAFLGRLPELASLRLYAAWGWGGYLGYRLGPRTKVFQDGRYLFHPLLIEAGRAMRDSPGAFQALLDRYRISAVMIENQPVMVPTVRRAPDGRERTLRRPYYIGYMPQTRWGLVYWDEQALLFVRKGAIPPTLGASLEYQLARPHDDEWLEEALRADASLRALLDAERARHRQQLDGLPADAS